MNYPITLGDPPGYYDDYNYTGDTGESPTTLQYYRNKLNEFQIKLNALDEMYAAIGSLYVVPDIPSEIIAQCDYWIADYQSKLGTIKAAAQGLQLAAEGMNAIGVRMPVISIPTTLGNPAVAAAVAAAIAAAAGAIYLINEKMQLGEETLRMANMLNNVTPAARDRIAQLYVQGQNAVALNNGSVTGNLSNSVKYAAFAAVAVVGLILVMQKR